MSWRESIPGLWTMRNGRFSGIFAGFFPNKTLEMTTRKRFMNPESTNDPIEGGRILTVIPENAIPGGLLLSLPHSNDRV